MSAQTLSKSIGLPNRKYSFIAGQTLSEFSEFDHVMAELRRFVPVSIHCLFGTLMVLCRTCRAVLNTGPGGTMKSRSTCEFLQTLGYECGKIGGHHTELGFYEAMYQNRHEGNIVVFDEFEDLLRKPSVIQTLKICVEENVPVQWRSFSPLLEAQDIPQSFEFHGSIIVNANTVERRGRLDLNVVAGFDRFLVNETTLTQEEQVKMIRSPKYRLSANVISLLRSRIHKAVSHSPHGSPLSLQEIAAVEDFLVCQIREKGRPGKDRNYGARMKLRVMAVAHFTKLFLGTLDMDFFEPLAERYVFQNLQVSGREESLPSWVLEMVPNERVLRTALRESLERSDVCRWSPTPGAKERKAQRQIEKFVEAGLLVAEGPNVYRRA